MKPFAVHCLARMGFGHKFSSSSSDAQTFEQLGATDDERLLAYLNQQLDWSNIDDGAFDAMLASAGYKTLNKTLTQQWQDHHVNSSAEGFNRDEPAEEMERLTVARALHSKRQLLEILSDFWHNHFNIQSRSFYAQSVFTSWDRDVIRPPVAGHPRKGGFENGHLLGNFRQMLELSSQHVAMQYYLDNYINKTGSPNENYAREIIELHSLGAENYVSLGDPKQISKTDIPMPWGPGGVDVLVSIADKYVDDDVYSAMRMLTGWKIKDNNKIESDNQDTADFFYYETWHDKFEKTILGYEWANFAANPDDIVQFFDMIAYHPGTAKHIAGKLCRRFISDKPSQTIIDEIASVFYQNRYASNQLELVYRALFQSSDFKDPANFNSKMKRPFEAIVGAMRATGSDFIPRPSNKDTNTIVTYFMDRAGQRPFDWPAPNGFSDESPYWQGGTVLIYLMRFFDWFIDKNNNKPERIVPIIEHTLNATNSELPNHSPDNLANFWMTKIFGYEPQGGWKGTDLHTHLRDFLRQNSSDPQQWPADAALTDISSNSFPHYFNERVRGLVKIILSSPEFLYR